MSDVSKRPQVIRDLIELATYIAEDNLEASDRFLAAAETTFKQLGKMPGMGKFCQFCQLLVGVSGASLSPTIRLITNNC